ncbi:MAG: ABC transporter permease [Candidatus Moranbacteria bacterium]|nr:ABC transporter permease [Candidatus Moranbacteria bacterium]
MHELIISIKLAFKNLRSNLGRTVLTLVGVVIGVIAVILVSSLGQGVKNFILAQVGTFGTDLIQVEVKVPATGKASTQNAIGQATGIQVTTMTIADAKDIGKLPNIAAYAPGTMTQELASYQNANKRVFLFGVGAGYSQIDQNTKLTEGAFFSQSDDESLAQVAVIGSNIRDAFFGDDDPLGKNIKIKNQNYKVVGLAGERGAVAGFNYDDLIYIPVQTMQKKLLGINYIRFVMVKVQNEKLIDETAAELTDEMRRLHKITDPSKDDFGVTSIKEAQATIASVFNTINILLLALTSISLVVGGVGIMNVMYVAVAERTFEIGLRKAVGAKAKNILRQFLWEAIFITFFGGMVGIILGYLLLLVLSYAAASFGFPINFGLSVNAISLAVGFSVATGVIFGYYPARAASRLSPMEALRKD